MNHKLVLIIAFLLTSLGYKSYAQQRPNIILIYADDLGFGDVSCYGATKIKTPNIDRVAAEGLRFTNAHASSATCTPSRFSLLTGQYAWRKSGTGIAPGDAALIIPTNQLTLPGVLQKAGYQTAVVGKWHLGLGPTGGPDWNSDIKPGPLEIGFDYSFILPATADRVPCVYVENHRIVNLDPGDPVQVSYTAPIGQEPTGKDHPELLKMKFSHGHDQTIVNGVSRIGYMSGGKSARWIDEDMADVLTRKAIQFIETNQKDRASAQRGDARRSDARPFFIYLATHDIHVPRLPNARFLGTSGLGPRGDAILQLDWTVGEITKTLDRLGLTDNTLLIISSDNGPVIDDGYQDQAVDKLNGHTPAGPLRGGKYSAFDAGTRVPLLVRWPGRVKVGTSDALVSQVDWLASFAALTGQPLGNADAPDSFVAIDALLGFTQQGRAYAIEQAISNTLSLIKGNWKYIEPSNGPKINKPTNTELGNDPEPQLYDLKTDVGEIKNVAGQHTQVVSELSALLKSVREKPRSR